MLETCDRDEQPRALEMRWRPSDGAAIPRDHPKNWAATPVFFLPRTVGMHRLRLESESGPAALRVRVWIRDRYSACFGVAHPLVLNMGVFGGTQTGFRVVVRTPNARSSSEPAEYENFAISCLRYRSGCDTMDAAHLGPVKKMWSCSCCDGLQAGRPATVVLVGRSLLPLLRTRALSALTRLSIPIAEARHDA